MEVSFHSFLTSTLDAGDWSVYSPEKKHAAPIDEQDGWIPEPVHT